MRPLIVCPFLLAVGILAAAAPAQKDPPPTGPVGKAEKPLTEVLDHLDELRSRLFRAAIAYVLAFVACWIVSDVVLDFLLQPIRDHLFDGGEIVFIHLTEPFMIHLKAAALPESHDAVAVRIHVALSYAARANVSADHASLGLLRGHAALLAAIRQSQDLGDDRLLSLALGNLGSPPCGYLKPSLAAGRGRGR